MISITVKNSVDNPSKIVELYKSIKEFMPEHKIIIHDSFSDDNQYVFDLLDHDRSYFDWLLYNENYIDSSVWNTYDKFPDEPFYWFLHDSCLLTNSLKEFEGEKFASYMHFNQLWDSEEQKEYAKKQIESLSDIKFNNSKGLFGIMFGVSNAVLKELKNIGLNKILPNNKMQMCASERIWGIALDQIGIDITKCSLNGDYFDSKHDANNHPYINKYFQERK